MPAHPHEFRSLGMGMKQDGEQHSAGRTVWARPMGLAVVNAVVLLFCTVPLGLFVFAIVYSIERGNRGLALFMLALLVFILLLIVYVARDLIGKLGGSITLEATGLELRLAPLRSLIHRPPGCRDFVPYADIRSVDWRLEAYANIGGGMMQRAYWLERIDKPEIFLFEERAVGTLLEDDSMNAVAREIAREANVPLIERPMARGRLGIMGVWFTRAPPYAATPLPLSVQARLWRRVWWTANLAGLAFLIVAIACLL